MSRWVQAVWPYSCRARRDDGRHTFCPQNVMDDCLGGFPQHSGFVSLHSTNWDRFTGSALNGGDCLASLPDHFTRVRRENVPAGCGTLDRQAVA